MFFAGEVPFSGTCVSIGERMITQSKAVFCHALDWFHAHVRYFCSYESLLTLPPKAVVLIVTPLDVAKAVSTSFYVRLLMSVCKCSELGGW